jgi:sec-independent protein translocase protein TatC
MSLSDQSDGMTLTDHLTELRSRLIKSAYAIAIGMIICYNFSDVLFNLIRAPIAPYLPAGGLVFTSPADKFIAHLKISAYGGIILTTPIWLYQLWKFIAPGLYDKERKYSVAFIFSGSSLFITGVLFAYFLVFPVAFEFLMGFGGDVDKPMITIDHYMSFVITTSLMFGVAFELPLIMVILGAMGLVSSRFFREKRRFAVVILAIICAILTPPDLLSMLLMLGPMIFLYEIGAFLIARIEKKRALEQAVVSIEPTTTDQF